MFLQDRLSCVDHLVLCHSTKVNGHNLFTHVTTLNGYHIAYLPMSIHDHMDITHPIYPCNHIIIDVPYLPISPYHIAYLPMLPHHIYITYPIYPCHHIT